MAGPGLVAIKEHRHLLKDDNLICLKMAQELQKLPYIKLDLSSI